MKKKLLSLLLCAVMLAAVLPLTVQSAHAEDYDRILNYEVDLTPNTQDGSLAIRTSFTWMPLADLDGTYVEGQSGIKIGIPNGSLRDMKALSSNISDIAYDNSYAYISFNRDFDANEVFDFSLSWVQEYMFSLDGSTVYYDYTPAWFDSIRIDRMTVTWHDPVGVVGTASDGVTENGTHVRTAENLGYGESLPLLVTYSNWPTVLDSQYSKEQLPSDYYDDPYDSYDSDSGGNAALGFIILLIVVFIFLRIITAANSYSGGFGTRYVYVGGLWYPRGPDGHPRPGSVGTKTRPTPPRSSGFGGGSRDRKSVV